MSERMSSKQVQNYVGSTSRNFAAHQVRRDLTFPRPLPSTHRTAESWFLTAEIVEWAKTYALKANQGRRGLAIENMKLAHANAASLKAAKHTAGVVGICRGKRDPLRMSTSAPFYPVFWQYYLSEATGRQEARPVDAFGFTGQRDERLESRWSL